MTLLRGVPEPDAARRGAGGLAAAVGAGQPIWVVAGGHRQGLTHVPTSAQLEFTSPLSTQLKLTLSPEEPKLIRGCVPRCSS
jgi:hypothetical protein